MLDLDLTSLPQIHYAELQSPQDLLHPLRAAFQREKHGPRVRRTHLFAGRYENTYIDRDQLPELAPLEAFALGCARQILGRETLRHGFWFNEMLPGQATTRHSHADEDELLSAVCYIDCPSDSGRLILFDGPARVIVTPQPGLLVLFPPDMPHEVETNRSDKARLSVAFNFGPALPPPG